MNLENILLRKLSQSEEDWDSEEWDSDCKNSRFLGTGNRRAAARA